jgi:hypothetical protein
MNKNRSAKLFGTPLAADRLSASLILLLALVALTCADARAQQTAAAAQQPHEDQQQREDGPPPMRYMPDDVRRRLEGERDPKARARLSLEIAEERLSLAAQYADSDHFEAATSEVGIYEAVVEDAIRCLQTPRRANNKLRDIFKHIEITLRSHVTRLESIRRVLPSQHAVYFKEAIEFVRDYRDQALAAFYDDTVVPEPRPTNGAVPAGVRAHSNALAPPESEKKPDQQH